MGVQQYNRKRDDNEPEIIAALRAAGASVVQISADGVPDLLVGIDDQTFLIEVKAPKGTLTESQQKFWGMWRGQKAIARTVEQALRIIGR